MFKLVTVSLASMLLAIIASIARCDEPRTGLSPDCKDVVNRMGDKNYVTGQHMAGPDQATLKALQSVPPDDSGKFTCSILISDHPQFKPACDRLLHDLDVAEQMLAFVKLRDPSKSWMIPQVRRIEDPTQKHWVDGVRPLLFPLDADGKAVPIKDPSGKVVAPIPPIVIKPPLNGRYGPNESVVTIIRGYNGDVSGTCERIQTAVEEWIHAHEAQGHEASDEPNIGRPAVDLSDPFTRPVAVPQVAFDPAAQSQWPEKRFNKPAEPKPLTAKQIKELVPNAPQSFRLTLLEDEVTDPFEVKERWLQYREQAIDAALKQTPEVVQTLPEETTDNGPLTTDKSEVHRTPENPIQAAPLSDVAQFGILLILVLAGIALYQVARKKTPPSTTSSNTSSTES